LTIPPFRCGYVSIVTTILTELCGWKIRGRAPKKSGQGL
jgi:hypothetical protein